MLTYQPVNLSTFSSGEGTLIKRGKQMKEGLNKDQKRQPVKFCFKIVKPLLN
jgi:hypothetical protein